MLLRESGSFLTRSLRHALEFEFRHYEIGDTSGSALHICALDRGPSGMTKTTFVGSANKGRWNLGDDRNHKDRRRSEGHLMGRIRSIHSTTPTDPDLAAISIAGRLLFIYSWTIADDAGNLERNPRGMKMALFPGDAAMTVNKVTKLTEELLAGRFYIPYEDAGKGYLHIRTFNKYQKPDRPLRPQFPLYPGQEYVYHVKQGTIWNTRKEIGGFVERTGNGQGSDSERAENVLAGKEWIGEERKGLDSKRTGPGREGEAAVVPSPLDRVGDSASPEKNGGNGKGASDGKLPEIKMDLIRKATNEDHQLTLRVFIDDVARGDMPKESAISTAARMGCLPRSDLELLFS